MYKNNLRLLGYPKANELAEIIVCAGLAQNFAALRAMVTVGIQKGHMNLHAKNIAISTGVPPYLAADCAEFMISRRKINKDGAINYIEALHLYTELRPNGNKLADKIPLSTFYVEIQYDDNHKPLVINIAFDCMTKKPLHLSIEKNPSQHSLPIEKEVHKAVIGEKRYEWLSDFLTALQGIRFGGSKWMSSLRLFRLRDVNWENMIDEELVQGKISLIHKLKILSVLISLTSNNLIKLNGPRFKQIYPLIKSDSNYNNLEEIKKTLEKDSIHFRFGIFLLYEMIKVLKYTLEQMMPSGIKLNLYIVEEVFLIIESAIAAYDLWVQADKGKFDFVKFLHFRKKRLSATMVLLCDALMIKQSDMNDTNFSKLKLLGEIIELEGTRVRDFSRWNESNLDEKNLYTYFLKMQGKINEGTSQLIQSEYFSFIQNIVEKKKAFLFSDNDYIFKDVYHSALQIIENYYHVGKQK